MWSKWSATGMLLRFGETGLILHFLGAAGCKISPLLTLMLIISKVVVLIFSFNSLASTWLALIWLYMLAMFCCFRSQSQATYWQPSAQQKSDTHTHSYRALYCLLNSKNFKSLSLSHLNGCILGWSILPRETWTKIAINEATLRFCLHLEWML